MIDALPARVARAEAAPLAPLDFLVEDELTRRADRLIARRLKQAGIITVKTLADFDWRFNPMIPKAQVIELASARFVHSHGGFLLIGPPGIGKSHVVMAIGVGAIHAGHRILVRQLTQADLLVLENFGMKKLGATAIEDLLEVFVRRHERASTLIITNRPTQDWGVVLGDETAATVILDRFLAYATILEMIGKSYRLRLRGSATPDD